MKELRMKYIPPQRGQKSFTCPHCGVLSRQYNYSQERASMDGRNDYYGHESLATSVCEHCNDFAVWIKNQMVYPNRGNAPLPNPDMPDDVKTDYEEAASIAALSPRGAAALLRLAVQKLCIHLGGKGENINQDIKKLVDQGLPPKIQRSLDVVRVIGNNAVHPGQIDTDDPQVADQLFILLNIITEAMISVPKRVDGLYSSLPESARDAIEKRDSK